MSETRDMKSRYASLERAVEKFTSSLHQKGSDRHSYYPIATIGRAATIPNGKTESVLILDSSFNPPTKAHREMAVSAMSQYANTSSPGKVPAPLTVLLLLSTKNADKAPQPASFPQRLIMMEDLMHDLYNAEGDSSDADSELRLEVALTSEALFTEKAVAIENYYNHDLDLIFLVGYDTLIRLLDVKYYPNGRLDSLGTFFNKSSLRVSARGDDSVLNGYIDALRNGERESEGGKKEWADRIQLVSNEEAKGKISSTKAREAAQKGDIMALKEQCTGSIVDYVLAEDLFRE
jgi:nicotinamide-nucleotide adenylyltransferase